MKTDIRKTGVTLLLFYLIFMLLSSSLTVIGDEIAVIMTKLHSSGAKMMRESSKGIALTIAIVIAMLVIFKWLRTDLKRDVLFRRGKKKMNWKTFGMSVLCLFGAQFLFSGVFIGLDEILEIFHLSIGSQIEAAQGMNQLPSQLVYTLILGPVAEELLFRGAIFQVLRKYGKTFAIFASAILFGIYHGNLPQGVTAFAIGILFAYITAEYSIYWSILIHIFNNVYTIWTNYGILKLNLEFLGVFSDLISAAALIVALRYLYKNRKKIKRYLKKYPSEEGIWRCLFGNKSVIVFTVLNIISAVGEMFL